MNAKLSFWPAFWASGILVALTFTLDMVFGILFPNWWVMQNFWEKILPGFTFITWGNFFLGLVESFLSGVYFAVIVVPVYNFILGRSSS
ncbi:MAG: DUF5676 family membrane protein, partial [Anaerolineales bacterium]